MTNLRQENLRQGPFERELLTRLDGTRDRRDLENGLYSVVLAGKLSVSQEGKPVSDETIARKIIAEAIERRLVEFARNSLLLP